MVKRKPIIFLVSLSVAFFLLLAPPRQEEIALFISLNARLNAILPGAFWLIITAMGGAVAVFMLPLAAARPRLRVRHRQGEGADPVG